MRMLKLLGLMVFVVFIAAFASGCGGGGGGSSMDTETPTVPTEPTEPTTPAEPETPETTITNIRATVLGILTGASELANTAAASATAIGGSEDVTEAQLSLAVTWQQNAQNALRQIVAANNLATSATTLEEAQQALSDAQTAFTSLQTAQTQLASIQADLTPVAATPPTTPPTTPTEGATAGTFTNNSSLIELVRANKLLSDAVLAATALTTGSAANDGSIRVGPAGNSGPSSETTRTVCPPPCAEFPANIGTGATAVTGKRTVRVPTANTITSDSKTLLLTGTGRLPHGFDLDNGTPTTDPTIFVNAYTDIAQERRVRNIAPEDITTTPHDERYDYKPDTDYLIAGIWLSVGENFAASRITAFAYGGQPLSLAPDFCTAVENNPSTEANSTSRVCENPVVAAFSTIEGFVEDGQDVTATYRGDANGAYIAGGDTNYFTASVELTAEFQNPTGGAATDNRGSIGGAVTNIVAGGQSMTGSIELQKQSLGTAADRNDISPAFFNGTSVGVVDGKSFSGGWKGQFFGQRATRSVASAPNESDSTITDVTTTYTSQAPGSVAGTFYATQQSNPAREAAFIGSFAARRQ